MLKRTGKNFGRKSRKVYICIYTCQFDEKSTKRNTRLPGLVDGANFKTRASQSKTKCAQIDRMSDVKRFHKKEAAIILVELRNKTEDERLMDCRRQLLTKDNNMDGNQNSREFQERMEQACWPCPWPYSYSNLVLPPYHTVPIGYPTWPHNPQYWLPNPTAYLPEMSTNPYIQAQFPGVAEYQANFTWPMLPHQQAYVDPGQSNRRKRTQFTDEQLAVFERTFTHGSKFPSPGERMRLESKTGISKDTISVWFSNRRAKEKREKGQDGGSKESTTTDSELETEDERQLSIYDETPDEDSEIEDTRNHQSKTIIDFKLTHPADFPTNIPIDMKPPRPEGQSTSGFYHSEIQDKEEHQNNTTSHIILSHPINIRTTEPTNIKLPCPERKRVSDIRQPHLANIHTITPNNIMLSYPNPERKINTPSDIKQPRSEEKSAVSSSGLYHGEIQDTRNDLNNTPSVSDINIPHQDGDGNTPHDIKIQPHRNIPTHTPTDGTFGIASSKLYHREIEDERNDQNYPPSDIKVEHPTNTCTHTTTSIRRLPRPEGTAESSKLYHKEIGGTQKYQNTLSDIKIMKRPLPEGTNYADSRGSCHSETEDASNHQNTTSDIKVLHQEGQSNRPNYIVLSLPGGTIAVESAEQYHKENGETRNDHNTPRGDVELLYPTSTFTNTTETKAPYPGETVAADVSGLYRSEVEDSGNSESTKARDIKLPHSANNSTNAPTEIKVPHPGGTVAVDLSGLYRSENENTSYFVPPIQRKTSCLNKSRESVVLSAKQQSRVKHLSWQHTSAV